MPQDVWESIYGRLGYLKALQSRAYRQIYGVPGRIGAGQMERRLEQEAVKASRLFQSGQISREEALRRQKRAYDIIGMLQEIGGDSRRGGTESDFYKIAQEIKDLTRFVQPGKDQRDISEYTGPLYNPDQLRQMAAFDNRHRLGAERMDPNERGYAPLTTLYDRAIEGLFDERDGRYTRTFDFGPLKLSPSAYGNRLFTKPVGPPSIGMQPSPEDVLYGGGPALPDSVPGGVGNLPTPVEHPSPEDLTNYIGGWSTPDGWKNHNSWSEEQIKEHLRNNPETVEWLKSQKDRIPEEQFGRMTEFVDWGNDTTSPVLNSGTKKAVQSIQKTQQSTQPTQQAASTKIEDKTKPESGSTAIAGPPLERLKKIMAKESTNQPVNKPEDTYKQTTFNAQQARERRRDPFTGGREAF